MRGYSQVNARRFAVSAVMQPQPVRQFTVHALNDSHGGNLGRRDDEEAIAAILGNARFPQGSQRLLHHLQTLPPDNLAILVSAVQCAEADHVGQQHGAVLALATATATAGGHGGRG